MFLHANIPTIAHANFISPYGCWGYLLMFDNDEQYHSSTLSLFARTLTATSDLRQTVPGGTRWWTSIYKNEKVGLLYTYLLPGNHCEILSLFLVTLVLLFPQPVSFPMDNTSLPAQKHPNSKVFNGPQECFKTWLRSDGLIWEKNILMSLTFPKTFNTSLPQDLVGLGRVTFFVYFSYIT